MDNEEMNPKIGKSGVLVMFNDDNKYDIKEEGFEITFNGYKVSYNEKDDFFTIDKDKKSVEVNLNNKSIWCKEGSQTNIYLEF